MMAPWRPMPTPSGRSWTCCALSTTLYTVGAETVLYSDVFADDASFFADFEALLLTALSGDMLRTHCQTTIYAALQACTQAAVMMPCPRPWSASCLFALSLR